MKSKWLSRVLLLSSGIIIGAIITSSLIIKSTKASNDLISLRSRAWEASQAINAYQGGNPEIARYALKHYADILGFYYENKSQDGFPEVTEQDLAFTYIRLGNIAKARKSFKEAEQYYDRGHTIYKQYRIISGKEVPPLEKLIEYVNKLDVQTKPTTTSFSNAFAERESDTSRRTLTDNMYKAIPIQQLFSNTKINHPYWFVLFIIAFTLLIRTIHTYFKAKAIAIGEIDDVKNQHEIKWEKKEFKDIFRSSFFSAGNDVRIDDFWLPFIIGIFELSIYPFLMVNGFWTAIAAWVAIKTASSWGGWQKTRTAYNRFLVGNILSLLASGFISLICF